MNPKPAFIFFLFLTLAFSGCVQSVIEREEDHRAFPETYDGPPVDYLQTGTPFGTWHARTEVDGYAAWIVRFEETPRFATWVAEWEPEKPAGYVAMAGPVLLSTHQGNKVSCLAVASWAEPNEQKISRVDTIDDCIFDTDSDVYLIFFIEAFESAGILEFMIEWDEGDVQPWEPRLMGAADAHKIEEHDLASGQALDLDIDMTEHRGVHVVIPCHENDPPATLNVTLGNEQPYLLDSRGVNRDERRSNWLSYGAIWDFPYDRANLHARYEGPQSPTIGIIRSATDWAQILADEIGDPQGFMMISSWCTPHFRNEGPDKEPLG